MAETESPEPWPTWEIRLREGVGPLRLGATREEIRKHLPGKLMTLRRFEFSPFPEDRVQDAGLMVDYDFDGRADYIEFYGPLSPTLDGRPFLERRPSDVTPRLRRLDPGLEVGSDGIESNRLGLAMSVSVERRIRTLGIFRERRSPMKHRLETSVSEHRTGFIGRRIYVRFDMSRAELRKHLGRTPIVRGRGRDVAPRLGVEVHYDGADRPVRLTARAPAVPRVNSNTLLGRDADQLARWFRALDRELQVGPRAIASPRFGLRFELLRKKVASVSTFADPLDARLPKVRAPRRPVRSTRLAWTPHGLRLLGQDGTHLFCGANGGLSGQIWSVPKAGGAHAIVVPGSVDVQSDVVTAGGRLFYVANVTDLVMEAPVGAGPSRTFSAEAVPAWGRVATDGRHVFWTSAGADQLVRKPIEGGAEEVLARELDVKTDLVVAGAHVYFFGTHRRGTAEALWGLLRAPCEGGAVEQADGWRGGPAWLRSHDGHLTWIITNDGSSHLVTRPPDAPLGATPVLVHADDQVVGPLARNRLACYWVDREERLWTRPHGAAAAVLHHDLNCDADGLLADDESLYWADRHGGVWRCPA